MKLFSTLYDKTLEWSRHRKAPWILSVLSFTESSFFPIPPDVMLAPMALVDRHKAWFFALLTTLSSVAGAVLGYVIGLFLFEQIGQPVIDFYHAQEAFETVKRWFIEYGVWIIFIAGFTPIPYKLFTITSGVMAMALMPFLVASLIGRGARFFLVAGLVYFFGEKVETHLKRHIDSIGWAILALLGLFIVYRTVI